MANHNLLKEAIADAKAVKDTAIANAKLALEEAFTPYLKEKLSLKLNEMESLDNEELEEEVTEEEGSDGDNLEATKSATEEVQTEEFSLDELLAELEEGEKTDDDEIIAPVVTSETSTEESLNEAEEETEEEVSIEDMSEDDLKSFIEDVIKDMVSTGELEAGESEEAEDVEGVEPLGDETPEEVEASEEEVDINELLDEETVTEGVWDKIKGTVSGIAKAANMFKQPADFVKELNTALKENPALKDDQEFMATYKFLSGLATASKAGATTSVNQPSESKLNEAYDAIDVLHKELNEINILNAKLLYTNKIFRNKNLTESQKVKVLTSFDKATTKKEVELVYETLKGEVKTSSTIPSSLKESLGSASKSIGNISNKQPIIEVNDAFKRMQDLAFGKK